MQMNWGKRSPGNSGLFYCAYALTLTRFKWECSFTENSKAQAWVLITAPNPYTTDEGILRTNLHDVRIEVTKPGWKY